MDAIIQITAQAAHEAVRRWAMHIGEIAAAPWDIAPEWERRSTYDGVRTHFAALAEGRELRPEEAHEKWWRHKLSEGWIYGSVKDADAKTHPLMIPYR